MPETVTIHSDFGADLLQRYEAMSQSAQTVAQAITDEADDYPVVVPTFGESPEDSHSMGARLEAIRTITLLHFPHASKLAPVLSGMLCASESTIDLIRDFNAAKEDFKATVLAIRNGETSGAKEIVNKEVSKGRRTPLLNLLLRNAQINTLDLKRCYTQVRILPAGIESFRWTWATHHARIKKLSIADAEAMIDALPADRQAAIETARDLLAQCTPGEILVRKTNHRHQLRANFTTHDDAGRKNHSCSISGIVIQPGVALPKYKWRDDPAEAGNNRPKRGASVEEHPYIQILDLYRYV
ncbi:MAG: hypothetical protein ACJAWL_002955 [Motiliproteus sp.]|jgi:hypothetical protein